MKVFLINPDYMLYPFPPIGLCYISGYARKYIPNLDIRIIDQYPEEKILGLIKKENPEIIGLASTSPHHYKVKDLATKIKKVSNGILVLGGIHITNCPQSFDKSPFDIAIRGEGELAFKRFLESVEKNKGINVEELKKVSGFLLRGKKGVINTGLGDRIQNLDEIPLPARDLLNMKYYSLPSFSDSNTFNSTGLMFTSRGCPYNCKFCSSSKFWQRNVKFFSAKRVAEEINVLYSKYNYKIIQIYDDLFTMNKPRLKEIIKLLDEKKILGKVEFRIFGRGNCFDEETAKLVKKLNVTEVGFGIETGSEKMLKYLKDDIKLEDNINSINICKKYGINPLGAFMIGMPYETKKDMDATYQFIKKYISNNFVIAQMSAFPNTPVWDYVIKNNLIKENIYETDEKRFLDFNENYSLSLDASKEDLRRYWEKIAFLGPGDVFGLKKLLLIFGPKNNFGLKKISTFRLNHLISLINPLFLKKFYSLAIKRTKQG